MLGSPVPPAWMATPGRIRWKGLPSYAPSRASCTKFRQARGASFGQSSMSRVPCEVCRRT